ncbi:hypothetical protein AMTRI_Chr07g24550 [Amborella trichopoda]
MSNASLCSTLQGQQLQRCPNSRCYFGSLMKLIFSQIAEWAVIPSSANHQMQSAHFKMGCCMRRKVFYGRAHRRYFSRKNCSFMSILSLKASSLFITSNATSSPTRRKLGIHPTKNITVRCHCLGTLENPELVLEWVPVVDQVLLMATAALAFVAGIIPSRKAHSSGKRVISYQDGLDSDAASSGSALKRGNQINVGYAWDEVQRKLVDAMDAVEHDGNLDNRVVGCENNSTRRPLSLHAIALGPRLQLLWATLQHLRKEVQNIPASNEFVNRDDWLMLLSRIVRVCIQPICIEWLQTGLSLESESENKGTVTQMFKKLGGDDAVLRNIRKCGKEDLYADLIFFLRFGSGRNGGYCGGKVLSEHVIDILEDLLITLADGITCIYLELISVDSALSSELNRLGLVLCSLSTRAIQRLRNEVALSNWLHQNVDSVVSMYEDRFDLCSLQTQIIKKPIESSSEKVSWWRKLTLGKPMETTSSLQCIVIREVSLPMKRTTELRSLTGWRYYFSLFLEFYDIAMPLLRALAAKVSSAVSFFLVCLIGRSLGLIYTGIRQALGWK